MQFTPASADVVPKTNKEDAVQAPQFRVVSTQIPIGGFKKCPVLSKCSARPNPHKRYTKFSFLFKREKDKHKRTVKIKRESLWRKCTYRIGMSRSNRGKEIVGRERERGLKSRGRLVVV